MVDCWGCGVRIVGTDSCQDRKLEEQTTVRCVNKPKFLQFIQHFWKETIRTYSCPSLQVPHLTVVPSYSCPYNQLSHCRLKCHILGTQSFFML